MIEYPTFEAAARAAAAGEPTGPVAVVYDAPIVLYFVKSDGVGKFNLVGAPFRGENYGISFPRNSELRHLVNQAILKLTEDGTYQQIRDKWFGSQAGQS